MSRVERRCDREDPPATADISFVIVSWQARQLLHECLVSLAAAARGVSHEVIVVDNASTDGSWELVSREFPGVTALRNDSNLGFARAVNRGVEASRGRYLCLVNSDVRVGRRCIEALLAVIEARPDVGLVGPRILNSDLSVQASCRAFPSVRRRVQRALGLDRLPGAGAQLGGEAITWWKHDRAREVDVISGCFWLVRRAAWDEVGGLDPRFFIYAEDVDFCRRLWSAQWKVLFTPAATAIHHGGGSSGNAPERFAVEKQRAELQYAQKHESRAAVVACVVIAIAHHAARCAGHAAMCLLWPRGRATREGKIRASGACVRWLVGPARLRAVVAGERLSPREG